jgi:hypothetical protein
LRHWGGRSRRAGATKEAGEGGASDIEEEGRERGGAIGGGGSPSPGEKMEEGSRRRGKESERRPVVKERDWMR